MDNFPSELFVFWIWGGVFKTFDGGMQGVNDIFRTAFGGVSMSPRVGSGGIERKEGREGLGGSWGRDGRSERERTM